MSNEITNEIAYVIMTPLPDYRRPQIVTSFGKCNKDDFEKIILKEAVRCMNEMSSEEPEDFKSWYQFYWENEDSYMHHHPLQINYFEGGVWKEVYFFDDQLLKKIDDLYKKTSQ